VRSEGNLEVIPGAAQEVDLVADLGAQTDVPPKPLYTDAGIKGETGISWEKSPDGSANLSTVDGSSFSP
jgi:hypothetical protein